MRNRVNQLKRSLLARLSIFTVLLMMVGLLFGCAQRGVQVLASGDAATVAQVITGATIQVNSIDGRPVSGGFIGQSQTFQLAPGPHRINLIYADLFETGADTHETVRSAEMDWQFEVEAGGVYRITHAPLTSPAAAKVFVDDPAFELVRENRSREGAAEGEESQASSRQPLRAFYLPAGAPASSLRTPDSSLRSLQQTFELAAPETQRQFLEWLQTR